MAEYAKVEVDINLEGGDSWDGEARPLVPEGIYRAKVVNVENKGNYLAMTFEITDGELAGSKAWNNYMLTTDPGKARLRNLMVACGASLGKFDSDEIVDVEIEIEVYHETGKARPGADGNIMEPKVFANVRKERAIARAEPQQTQAKDKAERPPVTREDVGTNKNQNRQGARRA